MHLKASELACVASVSVRFRRKERGTRVKDREKSGASKRAGRGWGRKEGNFLPYPSPSFTFWLSFHFSRGQNRKSPSSVFLCSETKRKRLLRRLRSLFPSGLADERETIDKVLKNCTCLEKSSINPQYYEVFNAKQQERPFSKLCLEFAFL